MLDHSDCHKNKTAGKIIISHNCAKNTCDMIKRNRLGVRIRGSEPHNGPGLAQAAIPVHPLTKAHTLTQALLCINKPDSVHMLNMVLTINFLYS